MNAIAPAFVDAPGVFIEEELEARGWTKSDLAFALGMSPQQLSPILTGKQGISPQMARALGDVFDVSPEFFANLNSLYQLSKTPVTDPGVRKRARWLEVFPLREMIERGWVEDGDSSLLDLQMLRFFCEQSVEDIPFVGNGEIMAHAARKQNYSDELTATQYAWITRVKRIAECMETPSFDSLALEQALPEIRAHMLSKEDLQEIPQILWRCGVRLVFVEALPGSKIDGVCAWLKDEPVIGMTLMRNRLDNFCFVLRHEIEHVLQGDGKDRSFALPDDVTAEFLDGAGLPEEERAANSAAAEFLVPQVKLESFMARKGQYISERDVLGLAASLQINPAIVVGQIQYRRQKYNWLRKYQKGIREYLIGWNYSDGWGRNFPIAL